MNKITNEELWDLCTEYVNDIEYVKDKQPSNYGDKAVNWDYERLNWEINRDLK